MLQVQGFKGEGFTVVQTRASMRIRHLNLCKRDIPNDGVAPPICRQGPHTARIPPSATPPACTRAGVLQGQTPPPAVCPCCRGAAGADYTCTPLQWRSRRPGASVHTHVRCGSRPVRSGPDASPVRMPVRSGPVRMPARSGPVRMPARSAGLMPRA